MAKKILFLLLFGICTVYAQSWTGSGTEGSPYLIQTASDLATLATNVNNDGTTYSGFYFWQTEDIDLSGYANWTPIGDYSTNHPFSGRYGVASGKKITGLVINNSSASNMGLFGYTLDANIQDVILENVNITAGSYVGALIGSSNNTAVHRSNSSGAVTGVGNIGGLVGYNNSGGNIISSSSSASVQGTNQNTGGLVGQNNGSTIESSSSSGSVSGTSFVGGIAGMNRINSSITKCYAAGNVTGTGTNIGGLAGANQLGGASYATISKSYSTGSVTGTNNVGGLIGANSPDATIENCYSRGSVTRSSGSLTEIGGFLGLNLGAVSISYSTGKVYESVGTIWDEEAGGKDKGFLGNSGGTNSNNFFDSDASEQTTGNGATAKTTLQMQTNTTFTDASWSSEIWNIGDGTNDGYPYLDWQNTGGTPLPVELTTFSAKYVYGEIVLTWQTATEVSNYGFSVERASTPLGMTWKSTSASLSASWETLGFVQGHGNSNSPKSYSFTDLNVPSGKVEYRLKQIDFDGKYEYSDIIEVNVETPAQFSLHQNYPNPFNPVTTISYKVQAASQVSLKVFDVLGREVATLVNEFQQPGSYNSQFSIRNSQFPSGVYFYRLQAGSFTSTKKMTLLK